MPSLGRVSARRVGTPDGVPPAAVLFETVGYRTLALRAVQERALLTSVG